MGQYGLILYSISNCNEYIHRAIQFPKNIFDRLVLNSTLFCYWHNYFIAVFWYSDFVNLIYRTSPNFFSLHRKWHHLSNCINCIFASARRKNLIKEWTFSCQIICLNTLEYYKRISSYWTNIYIWYQNNNFDC